MKLFNPLAAIITLLMSILMAIIFSMMVPSFMGLEGMNPNLCLCLWPVRWIAAYLLIILIVHPLSLKLSEKIFNFNPNEKKSCLWNPPVFFMTLMMSFIMAAIFGLPMGMGQEEFFYLWPLRWVSAYLLINVIVYPVSSWHMKKIFGLKSDKDRYND